MSQSVFDSLEALQAADDGAPVAVQDAAGRIAEFTKAANGLVSNGITMPWDLFTGSIKAGLVRDNTFREPQPGEWWNHGRWWFYIAHRDGNRVWYSTIAVVGGAYQVNNWFQAAEVEEFSRRHNRTFREREDVPSMLTSAIFEDLLGRFHASRRETQALTEQVNTHGAVTNGVFKERLQSVAGELNIPQLDSALASVGWGRPDRMTQVVLTIAGTCIIPGESLAEVIGSPENTVVSRGTARFTRTVTIDMPITEGNECLCRENYADKAREFYPPNVQTVNVSAQCGNH